MFKKYDYGGAKLLVQKIAGRYGVPVAQVLSHDRHPAFVAIRREIALGLYNAGFSYPEVGALMNRDHSTVHYLLNGRARKATPA